MWSINPENERVRKNFGKLGLSKEGGKLLTQSVVTKTQSAVSQKASVRKRI